MILLSTFAIGIAGLLVLVWLGFSLSRWLLPGALRPWRILLAPWLGYAAFVVLAQFTLHAGANALQTLLAAIAGATMLNVLAWWRGRAVGESRARAGEQDRAEPGGRDVVVDGQAESRGSLALLALPAAVSFALAVLPLLVYGYNTVVGENWDAEIYLALGEYLKTVPQSALAGQTPNPLLTTLIVPPYGLRTHGFSYFHAGLSGLLGAQSLDTLHPTLALLRALEVPAAYVFFRSLWGWRARPALVAAGLLALNPFLLWITLNAFGMQVPALGLLPAAAAVALVSLREGAIAGSAPRGWAPGAVGGGLLAAGLAVTYHPALTAWAAICGLGWLALLAERRQGRARLLAGGVLVALSAAALSAVAQWRSLEGFIAQYAEQVGGLGLTGFTFPGDALGLTLSFRTLLEPGPGQQLLALAAQGYRLSTIAALLCAAALGLWWALSEIRLRPAGAGVRLATAGAGLVYLLAFLWPLRYPYGWFKAQSFVAFLLVGIAVGGAWWLTGRPLIVDEPARAERSIPSRPLRRAAALAPALIPVLVLLATLGLTLWQYRSPIRYDQRMLDVAAVREWVRPGDPVLLGNSNRMPGRLFNGLAAYVLRDADLYGTFNTANAAWDRSRPEGAYRWALLHSRDLPGVFGYRAADRVWGNDLLALYRRPAGLLYHENWDRSGDYPRVFSRAGVSLAVGATAVAVGEGVSAGAEAPAVGPPAPRVLTLALATFQTQTLTLQVDSPALAASSSPTTTRISLAPGLQTVAITVTAPSTVTLSGDPEGALSEEAFVRWVTLERAERRAPLPEALTAERVAGVMMLAITTADAPPDIRTTLQVADDPASENPVDRLVLDVWRRGGHVHPQDHFGYWTFERTGRQLRFAIRPAATTVVAERGLRLAEDGQWLGTVGPGNYTAALSIYSGDRLLETITDIYTFEIRERPTGGTSVAGQALVVGNARPRRFPLLFY